MRNTENLGTSLLCLVLTFIGLGILADETGFSAVHLMVVASFILWPLLMGSGAILFVVYLMIVGMTGRRPKFKRPDPTLVVFPVEAPQKQHYLTINRKHAVVENASLDKEDVDGDIADATIGYVRDFCISIFFWTIVFSLLYDKSRLDFVPYAMYGLVGIFLTAAIWKYAPSPRRSVVPKPQAEVKLESVASYTYSTITLPIQMSNR